jgi:hypothetical protein
MINEKWKMINGKWLPFLVSEWFLSLDGDRVHLPDLQGGLA